MKMEDLLKNKCLKQNIYLDSRHIQGRSEEDKMSRVIQERKSRLQRESQLVEKLEMLHRQRNSMGCMGGLKRITITGKGLTSNGQAFESGYDDKVLDAVLLAITTQLNMDIRELEDELNL